jgi:hypothetical protein
MNPSDESTTQMDDLSTEVQEAGQSLNHAMSNELSERIADDIRHLRGRPLKLVEKWFQDHPAESLETDNAA